MDDETNWQRQVLIGLVVLVAVGALVGGIVALVSIKAADLAGIGSDGTSTVDRPRTNSGSGNGSTSGPTATGSTGTTTAPPTGPTASGTTSQPPDTGITLNVTPTQVSTYERINLAGTYAAPNGTVLQVQRKESGHWVDFPTTATVSGGAFHTYIETGHTGPNMLRVLAVGRDEASNTVKVVVS